MKFGNIDFKEDYAKDMTFSEFQKKFAGRLRHDLKDAFKKLGGSLRKKKE